MGVVWGACEVGRGGVGREGDPGVWRGGGEVYRNGHPNFAVKRGVIADSIVIIILVVMNNTYEALYLN